MEYIIFDIAIAALLLLALWRGYRRGFILTLCGFLAIFVAFIGATVLSNALAQPVAQAIQPVVERSLLNTLQEHTTQSAASQFPVETLDLPLDELLAALKESTVYQGFADAFQTAVEQGVVDVTTSAARALADYLAVQIARMVLFVLSFAAVLLAWFLLSRALDLAFKLPVLSTLNHWAGAGAGLLKGGLLLFIAAWLLKDSFLPPEAVANTYLLRFFCTTGPFSLLP